MDEMMMTAPWRKSCHSGTTNCVEAASWRKSSHSALGNCVEAGHGTGTVGVRDSQLGAGSPVLEVTTAAWRQFLAGLR